MKIQILAGALGLVLLLGMTPLPPAEANMFLIDDFSHDLGGALSCDKSLITGMLKFWQFAPGVADPILGVLGDWRACELNIDIANPSNVGIISVVAAPEDGAPPQANMFRHQAGTGVNTITTLTYDGTCGTQGGCLDNTGFSVNLMNSDDVKLVYSTSDQLVDVTVRVTSNNGAWAEQTDLLQIVTSVDTTILWPILDFINAPSASNGVLDLTDIGEFRFTLDTQVGLTDYDLENIMVTMEMVGGEMFPVDTTALLLAGVELNAIWILPAIAAIGIGAFIVSRKRN